MDPRTEDQIWKMNMQKKTVDSQISKLGKARYGTVYVLATGLLKRLRLKINRKFCDWDRFLRIQLCCNCSAEVVSAEPFPKIFFKPNMIFLILYNYVQLCSGL